MGRNAVWVLIVIIAEALSDSSLYSADQWPSDAVLRYTYSSVGEPSGAGDAFRDAVATWDAAATCYSFQEESNTQMGRIYWIANQDIWNSVRGEASETALAVGGADFSAHFVIYFNVAYWSASDWSATCSAGTADVMSIALHELGHVLGLGDCVDCASTVMKKPYDMSTPDCWSEPFQVDKNTVAAFCGSPPAASVEAFVPVLADGGVVVRADFGQMRGSQAFWVNRQDGSLVGDTISTKEMEGHAFELFDQRGAVTNRYFLFERDHRGTFLRAEEGVFGEKPELPVQAAGFDRASVERRLRDRFGARTQLSDSLSGMIICPDSFANTAQMLAKFWSTRGRLVSVVPLSQTGQSREEIKSYLESAYANGLRYVLLAGCASDYEWFDDPSKWPDYPGNNDWYFWYVDYHTPGGYYDLISRPERDLIPTWYFPDTLYDNMSYWTPYYSGDWYYGANLQELRIGRLPAANNSQLLAMIAKETDYVENTSALAWQHDAGIWGFCHSLDGNDGPLMKAIVQAFIDTIPASFQKHSLIDTNWTYVQREAQGLADWNAGRGIIWMQGTSSTAYKANHFFSKSGGWHIGKLDAGKLAFLVGANCGIGAYDMAQSPTNGETVAQELLGASADRGVWGMIAPTRGTWIEGDRQICYALNKYFSLEPVEDIGTAFMLAQREVRSGNEHECAESFNLFGDPMAPVPTKVVSGVGQQPPDAARLRIFPNPFNPSVTIEYYVPRACLVDLAIFNVMGQRICRLVNTPQHEGVHRLIWAGIDQDGSRVSSGVYFCRLQLGRYRELRKMVLVR